MNRDVERARSLAHEGRPDLRIVQDTPLRLTKRGEWWAAFATGAAVVAVIALVVAGWWIAVPNSVANR